MIHATLHSALADAVRMEILPSNVASAAQPPRLRSIEARSASLADIEVLLAACERSPYRIPILLVIATGMRRGEVCGLKWSDFDADRQLLVIRRGIIHAPGHVYAKPPKSGRTRVVPIPDSLARILLEHKTSVADAGDDEWVCVRPDGSVIIPNTLGVAFRALCTRNGVEHLTLHGLRHAQATMLIAAGVPARVVSERLGHATTAITLDLYAHVLPHMQDHAVAIMEELLVHQKCTAKTRA